jgi:hypothetical protein
VVQEISLQCLANKLKVVSIEFNHISFSHVYGELYREADALSKISLSRPMENLFIKESEFENII